MTRNTEIDIRIREDRLDALRRMGHELIVREETFLTSYFGRPFAAMIVPRSARLVADVNTVTPSIVLGL